MSIECTKGLCFRGMVVQAVLSLLGVIVVFFGGWHIGFQGPAFLMTSVIPWAALYCSFFSKREAEDFFDEWNLSLSGSMAAFLGICSISSLFLPDYEISRPSLPFWISLIVSCSMTVLSWFAKSYLDIVAGGNGPLKHCADYLRGSFFVGCMTTGQVILCRFGRYDLSDAIGLGMLSFNLAVASELGLSLLSNWYRPSGTGPCRWFHASRILVLLGRSSSLGKVVREFLFFQFGVDFSKSRFLRNVEAFLPIGGFIVLSLILGLSSLSIVPPGHRAVLLRWGRPKAVFPSGLHMKLPWPVDRVISLNIGEIRRIHVGSHSSFAGEDAVYVSGIPVLWTNEHGLLSEVYIPVAPPADVADVVSGRRIPSVSFVGADVFVEYRISDPMKYLASGEGCVELFRRMAERATSRVFYKYDVDALVGEGRTEAGRLIMRELEKNSDAMGLGLSVGYVGIVGVHPPQPVASFFEETVSARQERETTIQWAHQAAILRMTETVGNVNDADDLIGSIDSFDGDSERIDSILMDSGGSVASVMAKAVGYGFSRKSREKVRCDRFLSQFSIFSEAPLYYGRSLYLDVLDDTLPYRRKYLLPKRRKDLTFRLSGLAPALSLPGNESERDENPEEE